jgi:hypothetical protein
MSNREIVHVIMSNGPHILYLKLLKRFLLHLISGGVYSEISWIHFTSVLIHVYYIGGIYFLL